MEVQLPRAQKAGIEVIANCDVGRVEEGRVFATVRAAPTGSVTGKLSAGDYIFSAKKVVLAGGTAGTPAILLRSGFGRKLPAIGKYVTLHPALVV